MTPVHNGNRNLVQWFVGILGVLASAFIIYGATASIETKLDVRELRTEQSSMKTAIQELKLEVGQLDDKLDAIQLANSNSGGS